MAAVAAGGMQRMIDQAFATSQSLTLQQFEAQSLARFDAMDLNHDGTVTAAERQADRGASGACPSGAKSAAKPASLSKRVFARSLAS